MKSDFDRKVDRLAEELKRAPYTDMESAAVKKMTAWFEENRGEITGQGRSSPREAYELLIIDYLGIPREEAPVVSETADDIVWLSTNRCLTLEACQKTASTPERSAGLPVRNRLRLSSPNWIPVCGFTGATGKSGPTLPTAGRWSSAWTSRR
jgi:hypothetical protein